MANARDKRIADLEKAAGRIAGRRRPGGFTLEGLLGFVLDLCGAETRDLVEAALDLRAVCGREGVCEAIERALVAVLGEGDREEYRAACAELREAWGREGPQEAPQEAQSPGARPDPPAVLRAPQIEPEAPATRGDRLAAEAELLPDVVLSNEQVEVLRRLPGEGPVYPEGVPRRAEHTGWKPMEPEGLFDWEGWRR